MALGDVIARLSVVLGLDTAAFEKGATLSEKRLAQSAKRFEALGGKFTDLGQTLSLGLTAPLTAFGVTAVQAAKESADALGQVESALASMGDASGRTVEQLQKLAANQMARSLYDDDEILRRVSANLITFGNVSGRVFDRAQQAALDLSARLGQDLKASAIQLGKALNDPVKGLAALGRVGVQFTQQQKDQVKALVETGEIAKAQGIILAEVERQFAGAAEAARKADPFAAMKQSFADFQETVGGELVKALPAITGAITTVLEAFNSLSPGVQKAVVVIGVLAAAFGPVLIGLGAVVTATAPLIAAFTAIAGAAGGFAGVLVAAVASLGGLVVALGPVLVPLAAVTAAAGAAYLAFKNWDKIVAFVKPGLDALDRFTLKVENMARAVPGLIRNMVSEIGSAIVGRLNAVWQQATAAVERVRQVFFNLWDKVTRRSYIPDMVDDIAQEMARLDAVLVRPVEAATGAAETAFRDLAAKARPILDRLFPDAARLREFHDEMKTLGDLAASGGLDARPALQRERTVGIAGEGINAGASRFAEFARRATGEFDRLRDAADRAGKVIFDIKEIGARGFDSLANGLADAILGFRSLGDVIRSVVAELAKMALTSFIRSVGAGIGIPIPGFASGTNFAPGGLALVGERGPELVNIPRGSRVYDHRESQRMMGGGPTLNITVNGAMSDRQARATGAQIGRAAVRQMNGPVRNTA